LLRQKRYRPAVKLNNHHKVFIWKGCCKNATLWSMKKIIAILSLISLPVFAANVPPASRVWNGLTPNSTPVVTTQFIVTQSTVVTVTVPYLANQLIYSGDGGSICEDPIVNRRCSQTYPTTSVSQTGWIKAYDGMQRVLPGNLQVSTSYIYLRSGAVSNTTHNFEWSYQ